MYTELRNIRSTKNISSEEMAEVIGLKTRGAYYKKETGAVKFSLDEARLIAIYLNKTIEEIFFSNDVS